MRLLKENSMSDIDLGVRKTDRDTSRRITNCNTCQPEFKERCNQIYEICVRNPKNWDGHSFCSKCGHHHFVHNIDGSCVKFVT